MRIEVIATPKLLQSEHVEGRVVVVLDVLRATTTIIAALAAGCREINVYIDLEETRAAAAAHSGPKILCGERRAQPPPGFDLGNSPGDFTIQRCAGRTLFMSTTNGTPAIAAAGAAPLVLIGAIANRTAVAKRLTSDGRDVTILCAGQRGDVALEDLLGAGAIISAAAGQGKVEHINDAATFSHELFELHRDRLGEVFRRCRGARTELLSGLEKDIDFCAVADRFDVIGVLNPPRTVSPLPD